MADIDTAKILILATHGFEQSELEVPRDKLRASGATVHVASPDGKAIRGWDATDWGREAAVDLKISDTDPADYDALVLPGGQINPDVLRTDADAVDRVRRFTEAGKTVAAICHGPWMLVEADVVRGAEVTAYPSIRTDLRNAGARVVDKPVAVDGPLITSRNPDDLDAFVTAIVDRIAGQSGRRDAA